MNELFEMLNGTSYDGGSAAESGTLASEVPHDKKPLLGSTGMSRGEMQSWRKMKEYLAYQASHPKKKRFTASDNTLWRLFQSKKLTFRWFVVILVIFGVLPLIFLLFSQLSTLEAIACAGLLLMVTGATPATFVWCYYAENGETFRFNQQARLQPEDIIPKHDDRGHDLVEVSQAVSMVENIWSASSMISSRPGKATQALLDYDMNVAGYSSDTACQAARYILHAYWQGRCDYFSSNVSQSLELLWDGISAYMAIHTDKPDSNIVANMNTVLEKTAETVKNALNSVPLTNNMAADMTPEEFLAFTADLAKEE